MATDEMHKNSFINNIFSCIRLDNNIEMQPKAFNENTMNPSIIRVGWAIAKNIKIASPTWM